ncbi:MAG: hypothetical protein HY744_02620 [Deltaproteobacteria bacterium]|nr:hypothetical protein [Deltaproteobacteria bacterium]
MSTLSALGLAGALLAAGAMMMTPGCGSAEGADAIKGAGATTGTGAAGAAGGGPGGAAGAGGELGGAGGGGAGGEAGAPAFVPDPFQPPAGDVGQWSGKLPPGGLLDPDATVYFPKSPAPGETFPLVVFAHESGVGDQAYEQSLAHLAKFGYVLASVEYEWNPLAQDHHAPVDSMLKAIDLLTKSPPEEIGAIADAGRVAAAGHGIGAKAALWMALEGAPVQAVLALDPIDDDQGMIPSDKRPSLTPEMMGAMAVPVLYLATQLGPKGLTQCVPGKSNACRFHEKTPPGASSWLMVLESFGHMQLVDAYNCPACLTCERGPEPEHAPTLLVARGLAVAFLQYALKTESGYLPYLEGAPLADLRSKNRVLDGEEQFAFCAEQ